MATTYTLSPSPWQHFDHIDGTPASNGRLYTYLSGTTTPATTYSTSSGTPNSNPIQLDAAGNCYIYLAPGSYRFDLYDAPLTSDPQSGGLIKTSDPVTATGSTSGGGDIDGIAGEILSDGNAVYLSDGSGGKQAGRWYKAKADNGYSSTLPEVGFAIGDIGAGLTGSIRQSGRVTSGIVVTVGLNYYISSTTAGDITATAPALARFVGQADSGTSLVISPNPATAGLLDMIQIEVFL